LQLLISDGIVEEFSGRVRAPVRVKKAKPAVMTGPQKNGAANVVAAEPRALTAEGEALAGRIREWRAAEAKRLKVPAYVVLHDRTLTALAGARPTESAGIAEHRWDGSGQGGAVWGGAFAVVRG
jgi:superfamily II DNA helicase RecQ